MSITRPRQRTRNVLIVALILSAFIHVVGGALWDWFAPVLVRFIPKPMRIGSLREPPPPLADIIRLERRPAAPSRPQHENRVVKVAPRPRPVATLTPSLPRPRHELAHIRAHAPAQPPVAHGTISLTTPEHDKPIAQAPVPDRKPALSDKQIAELGSTFSKTIADSRETLAGVQADSEKAPVVPTVKHYSVHFSGIHEGLNPGDGDIYPISHQRIGNTMWYYTRYTYMHSDGTYEADAIPWPFHYPINDDPFARHDKRIPIQPPPPDYKPDRPLKPILEQFFGGPPVTD